MLHKSSYTLEKTNSNHLHPNYQQYSKSVDHSKYVKSIDQHIHHHNNDPVDTRQSNIQQFRPPDNYSSSNLITSSNNYPTTSSSTASTESNPMQYERISLLDQSHQIMSNNAAGKQIIVENQFSTKSLSVRGGGGIGVDTMAKINKFEHEKMMASSARKRDEYQPDAISVGKYFGKQSRGNAEHLYGRIQSRTFSTSSNGVGGGETPTSICGGNYDRCNANVQLKDSGTKRGDNTNGVVVMNCVNNNHHSYGGDGHQLHHFNHHNGSNNNNNNNNFNDINLLTDGYVGKNKVNLGKQPINPTVQTNVREKNRNMLRTNRYSNGSHLTAPGGGTHQLAHMINSLSSPESAYSTGYSTDGTSPGESIFFNF